MKKNKIRVLLTAANGPGGVGIIHALKSHPTKEVEVIAGTVDSYEGADIVAANKSIRIPYVSDNHFISKMLEICKMEHIDLIVPGFSQEILELVQHEKMFNENGVKILCPSEENVRMCHHKDEMQEYLKKVDSDYVIPYRVAHTVDELKRLCIEMGYPNKKICVKPAICNGGSRGFFILDENYDRYKSYFLEKDSKVCSLDELMLKFKGLNEIPKILVMEYIQGEEYGIDVVAQEGKVIAQVLRKKLEPKIASIDMRLSVEENDQISELINKVVGELKLNSVINIDVICDTKTGKPYVLEINPRQAATIGISVQKANLLAMAIDLKFNEEIIPDHYTTSYENIIGIRYIEEFCLCDGDVVRYKK